MLADLPSLGFTSDDDDMELCRLCIRIVETYCSKNVVEYPPTRAAHDERCRYVMHRGTMHALYITKTGIAAYLRAERRDVKPSIRMIMNSCCPRRLIGCIDSIVVGIDAADTRSSRVLLESPFGYVGLGFDATFLVLGQHCCMVRDEVLNCQPAMCA